MTLPPTPGFDIEQVLEDFESAWRAGAPPSLAPLLTRLPLDHPEVHEFVHELITIDLEYRWRENRVAPPPARPLLEKYLQRYPVLGTSETVAPELIASEYKVRLWAGELPQQEEYLARFAPDNAGRADAIRAELKQIDEELNAEAARRDRFRFGELDAAPSAPPVSHADLLAILRQHRLLWDKQIDELNRDGELARCPDAASLAQELMRRDWLTPLQAHMLLRGRTASLFVGPYVLLERLGAGAMGQVYKARHQYLGRIAAVKVFRKGLLTELGSEGLARFYQEVQAAGRLAHPHVVHAYDAGPGGAAHFLAMEFHESIDLARLVQQAGPLPIQQACDYLRQAALGLQHAHERGLVHRDIKPSNLLVALPSMWQAASPPGASAWGLVKILDLGLARLSHNLRSSNSLTLEGDMVGTPDYMAPEQAEDPHSADIRADLYSLGCTFYFMLTGQPPFPGGNFLQKVNRHRSEEPAPVEHLRPEVPARIGRLLSLLLAKRPEDRLPSPAELVRELASSSAGTPAEVFADLEEAGESADPGRRVSLRQEWRRLLAATVVTLVMVIAVGYMLFNTRLPVESKETAPAAPAAASAPREITNSVGMKFTLIPAGNFVMGSSLNEPGRKPDEGPQRKVTISRAFYLGVYEVTQEQYERVIHHNPAHFSQKNGGGVNHPVECVSWEEAGAFCRQLTERSAERRAGRSYRLPTEAEWEYACRAGTSTPYFYEPQRMNEFAWHTGNSGGTTHPVGQLRPNPWGLYDISGNVWEWCADYNAPYPGSVEDVDPAGPQAGTYRVFRGGCWVSWRPEWLRSAHRDPFAVGPDRRQANIGFRVVCDLSAHR